MDIQHPHYELVEKCKNGQRNAQAELYRLYSRAMFNTALRMVNNPHDAEDLLQGVFVEVFTKIDTFRHESSIGAWIKRITVNKCINHLKSRRATFVELTASVDRSEEDGEYSTTSDTMFSVERINRAINELPDGYRVVFSLYALEGYDHEEIGQILGVSEATSKSQYSRAKAKLRERLSVK